MASAYPQYNAAIPYTTPATRLQTLDIWLPRPLATSSAYSPRFQTWLVYVHGGAWRDPAQTSLCIQPAIKHLQHSHSTAVNHITGLASINYRLSPYPDHSTDPSSPTDDQRNVRHPVHVTDIHLALNYLRKQYHLERWIGVGHSCGATLLLQLASGIGLARQPVGLPSPATGLHGLILLEGIYHIPLLLQNHSPPTCPESISQIYKDIVLGAFGQDAVAQEEASPVSGTYTQVPRGCRVVLGHSPQDELVEEEQRAVMFQRLREDGWVTQSRPGAKAEDEKTVEQRDLHGVHDQIWEDGKQIAQLIADMIG